MAKTYKAVPMDGVEERYQIVDNETGRMLDNAQGYGYKTKSGAYKSYAYILKHQEA